MKTKTTYNIDQIVSITLVDKTEAVFLAKSFLGSIISLCNLKVYTKEELISQGFLIEDGKSYYKPYLQVTYSNGNICKMRHDTMESATKEYNKLVKTINKSIEL